MKKNNDMKNQSHENKYFCHPQRIKDKFPQCQKNMLNFLNAIIFRFEQQCHTYHFKLAATRS